MKASSVRTARLTVMAPTDALRGYQRREMRDVERALSEHRSVILQAFMGSGKTVTAAALVRKWLAGGARVLVLVHRGEILKQTRRKLIAAGIPAGSIGIIWAAHKGVNLDAPVQLASVHTLVRREDVPDRITHVVIDECHHVQAASWKRILGWYPKASVLGLTATPERLDGKPLGEFFEEMVLGEPAENLVDDGHLTRPEIWTREDGWRPKGLKKQGGDYAAKAAAKAMSGSTIVGGIPRSYLKHAKGMPAVLFAATKDQARELVAALKKAGVSADTLFDEDTENERDAKLARLRTKKTMVLATCDVLGEGWDYDGCRCVIMARPTASLTRYMQWAGRCMRPGARSVVLDHAGNFYGFGPPWEEREWSLHTKPRGSLHAAEVDANGGVTFVPPTEVDGKLVRADAVNRQDKCAGWEGSCQKGWPAPSRLAHTAYAIKQRNGRPWRCISCGNRMARTHPSMAVEQMRARALRAVALRSPEERVAGISKAIAAKRRMLTAFGQTQSVTDWARQIGMLPTTLSSRLEHGWSLTAALTVPADRSNSRLPGATKRDRNTRRSRSSR